MDWKRDSASGKVIVTYYRAAFQGSQPEIWARRPQTYLRVLDHRSITRAGPSAPRPITEGGYKDLQRDRHEHGLLRQRLYQRRLTGRQRFVFPNSVIDCGGGKYTPNTNVTVDDANFNFCPASTIRDSELLISGLRLEIEEK